MTATIAQPDIKPPMPKTRLLTREGVVAVGLKGVVIINTDDTLLVVSKTEILKVTDLVNSLLEHSKTEKFV